MKSYDEILKMIGIEDEKVYFNNKGLVSAEDVKIMEDYTWSEASGMLYGSELDEYVILKEGKELKSDDYKKVNFKYIDNTERYNESGEKYHKNKSYDYINNGVDLSEAEVYIMYANYNNNNVDSFNVDIYTIK